MIIGLNRGNVVTSPIPDSIVKYAVICAGDTFGKSCGVVALDDKGYERQMTNPDAFWYCPECGSSADWDDDTYERYLDSL